MTEEPTENLLVKAGLLEQAANSSSEGITISDINRPDQPLIFVNQGFERLTGYDRSEVIGRNCRFLQGPKTARSPVTRLREAIANGEECTVELLNYRKNGQPFWNRLSVTPISDHNGKITHYVGIQSDITLLKRTKERLEQANQTLRHFQDRILTELDQAKIAQQFLLPDSWPETNEIEFAAKMEPTDEIGGDFFDVIALDDHRYGFLVADVTGHGIPAALLTFMASVTFKNVASSDLGAGETITEVNRRLFGKMPNDAFVTMFYAIYNVVSKEFNFAQAGHPDCYLFRPSVDKIMTLSTEGTIVGPFSNEDVSFGDASIHLEEGDRIILYTDAITDVLWQVADSGQITDLGAFIRNHSNLSMQSLFEAIYSWGIEIARSSKYSDDFTMLGFEVTNKKKKSSTDLTKEKKM